MRWAIVLCCFVVLALAGDEKSLENDASMPTGFTEQVVLIKSAKNVPKYSSKLYNSRKAPRATVNNTAMCGPVKQQSATSEETDKGCGSCWSFASIGCAELAYRRATGNKQTFSEMELVDCLYHSGGCNGENRNKAMMHIYNTGVTKISDYPYHPYDSKTCNTKVTRYYKYKFIPFMISSKNDNEWKSFIDNYGGFAVNFFYGTFKFDSSKKIVVDCEGASADPRAINHAVIAVGYGKSNGIDYMIIRNSWGSDASNHEYGYFRIKVGACNMRSDSFEGFIYDNCDSFNQKKTSCESHSYCRYNILSKKCYFYTNTILKKASNAITDSLANVAEKVDTWVDSINGVGLNNLPSSHFLRKNGTEFFAYLKIANKIKTVKIVTDLANQAKSKGYIDSNGTIIPGKHSALKSFLGIKKTVTLFLATKAKSNSVEKSDRSNWFYIIKAKNKWNFASFSFKKAYYDPRYNRIDYADVFEIIGTSVNGVLTFASETAGGFGKNDVAKADKDYFSEWLVALIRSTGLRYRDFATQKAIALYNKGYVKKGGQIVNMTKVKEYLGIKKTVILYLDDHVYLPLGGQCWNAYSNTLTTCGKSWKSYNY